MIATMHSEWLKFATVRMHHVLMIIAVVFPVVVVVLVTALTSDLLTFNGADLAELVAGTSVVSVMLMGVVVATGLTGEFSHGTIRPTYAATPGRSRVMLAKIVVGTVAVAGIAAVLVAICFVLGSMIAGGRGGDTSLSTDDGSLGSLIALVVLAVLVGWFAFGVGLIVRNAPATISLILVWPLILEGIIAGVLSLLGWDDALYRMPYSAALQTIVATPDPEALGRPGGWLLFAVFGWALILIGLLLDERRDA